MRIFLLLPLFAIFPAGATDLIFHHEVPLNLKVHIIKVEWSDFQKFILYDSNGNTHELYCKDVEQLEYEKHPSHIEFGNAWDARVAKFRMDDKACLHLWEYLKAVWEAVDFNHAMTINFNMEKRLVAEVHLPKLNPFEDGDPHNQNGLLRETLE